MELRLSHLDRIYMHIHKDTDRLTLERFFSYFVLLALIAMKMFWKWEKKRLPALESNEHTHLIIQWWWFAFSATHIQIPLSLDDGDRKWNACLDWGKIAVCVCMSVWKKTKLSLSWACPLQWLQIDCLRLTLHALFVIYIHNFTSHKKRWSNF